MRPLEVASAAILGLCFVQLIGAVPLVTSGRQGPDFWNAVARPVTVRRNHNVFGFSNSFKQPWYNQGRAGPCPFDRSGGNTQFCVLQDLRTCPWDGYVCTCREPHTGDNSHADVIPSAIEIHDLQGNKVSDETLRVNFECTLGGQVITGGRRRRTAPGGRRLMHAATGFPHEDVFHPVNSKCTYTPQEWTSHFFQTQGWSCFITPPAWDRTCLGEYSYCSATDTCRFDNPLVQAIPYLPVIPYYPKVCPQLPSVVNGWWSYHHYDGFGYSNQTHSISACGSYATLHCDSCYVLTNPLAQNLTCDGTQWLNSASQFPSCSIRPVHCDGEPPAAPQYGLRRGAGRICGDNRTYIAENTCYSPTGPTTSYCQVNGTWSPITGLSFGLNYCPSPPPVANATAWKFTHYSFSPWHSGITYSTAFKATCGTDILTACDYCFEKKSGDLLRHCMAGDAAYNTAVHKERNFDGTQPVCGVKTCPQLPPLVDGVWVHSHQQGYGYSAATANGTTEYASCGSFSTAVCKQCYCPHYGNATRSCGHHNGPNGPLSWTGISPRCVPTHDWCPANPPAAPLNAVMGSFNKDCEATVTYDCKPCHARAGTYTSSCGVDTLWTNIDSMTCTLIECDLPPVPAHSNGWSMVHNAHTESVSGTVTTATYGSGSGATATLSCGSQISTSCKYCYTFTAGDLTRTCDVSTDVGLFSGQNPECSLNTCPQLPAVQNGYWSYTHNGYGYGSVGSCGSQVQLLCDTCFEVDPDFSNGTHSCDGASWSNYNSVPRCRKISGWCKTPPPAAPLNSRMVGNSSTCGSQMTYNCNPCFYRTGGVAMESSYTSTCSQYGATNQFYPTINSYAPNTTINQQQFNITGILSQRVNVNETFGNWSAITTSCQLITCPPLLGVQNADLWAYNANPYTEAGITGNYGSASTHTCGSTARTKCNYCYRPTGNLNRTCVTDSVTGVGQFDGVQPTCILETCSPLPAVANGYWSYSHPAVPGAGTDAHPSCESTATLQCDTCYYQSSGNATRTCRHGTNSSFAAIFDGTQPTCTRIPGWCQAEPPLEPVNAVRIGNDTRCGDQMKYQCKPCYHQSVGISVSTCNTATRQWSAIGFTCTLSECATPAQPANAHPWSFTHSEFTASIPGYHLNPVFHTLGRGTGQPAVGATPRGINTCGTSITMNCKYCHHVTNGSATRSCDVSSGAQTGVFTPGQPQCTLKTHAPLPAVPNGVWTYVHSPSGSPHGYGQVSSCHTVVTLTCDTCFRLEGNGGYPSSTFDGDDWSHNPFNLRCVGEPNWCTDPVAAAPDHGQRTGSGTQCGATRTYTCDTCYQLNIGQNMNTITSTCQPNRKWSLVDVSCHPKICPTLPPQPANAAPWTRHGSVAAVSCGYNITTSCDYCYSQTGGNMMRTCESQTSNPLLPQTAFNGVNPTCEKNTCPALPPTSNGQWSMTHVAGYGGNDTASCGTKATLTCDSCYRVQWPGQSYSDYDRDLAATRTTLGGPGLAVKDGGTGPFGTGPGYVSAAQYGSAAGFINYANTIELECNGNQWTGAEYGLLPFCTASTHICDADVIDLSTKNGMTATFDYVGWGGPTSSNGHGAICGDTITYSCPRCMKHSVQGVYRQGSAPQANYYPDPYVHRITRTCQSDGTWSGEANFDCTANNYQEYTFNMLTQEHEEFTYPYTSLRQGYSWQLSPYECEHNFTLCPECQTNIDTKCRALAWQGYDDQYHAEYFAECKGIAKNECPARCTNNVTGAAEICLPCRLDEEGLNHCAATARCLCDSAFGAWYGDGCQDTTFIPTLQWYAGSEYEGDLFPWWMPIVVVLGICCGCYFAVHCYSQECVKGDAPSMNDACAGGGCWYNLWYYHWYYFLCGCFCATDERGRRAFRRPGQNSNIFYQFCYGCYQTVLCGCFCTPRAEPDPMVHKEAEQGVGMEMNKNFRGALEYEAQFETKGRYPRAPPQM